MICPSALPFARSVGTRFVGTRFVGICAAMLALVGCVSVLPEAGPAPETYRLSMQGTKRAATDAPAPMPADATVIIVHRPSAPAELSTDRVALVSPTGALAYAADARWASTAPALVGDRVFDALEALALSPVRASDGVRADVSLRLELLAFEADYSRGGSAGNAATTSVGRNAPMVRVALRARVIDDTSRTLLGARRFDVTLPATGDTLPEIMAAFNGASTQIMTALSAWVVAVPGLVEG